MLPDLVALGAAWPGLKLRLAVIAMFDQGTFIALRILRAAYLPAVSDEIDV